MDLRGKLPHDTFESIVTTDGTHLYDGSGSLMTSLTITSITSSHITNSITSESIVTASNIKAVNNLVVGGSGTITNVYPTSVYWIPDIHSDYRLYLFSNQLRLLYDYNDGGNAQALFDASTSSFNLYVPLIINGVSNNLLYAANDGTVEAVPTGTSVNITASAAMSSSFALSSITSSFALSSTTSSFALSVSPNDILYVNHLDGNTSV